MSRLVLVTGATGTVGSEVVDTLVDRQTSGEDVTVRAAVRDPDAASLPGSVEAVEFDFQRPETWGRALDGVTHLFLMLPPGNGTDAVRRFADAAARTGVEHVTYLSVLGADRLPVLPHHRVEDHLTSLPVNHTFLRASFFVQNLFEVHRADVVDRGEIAVPAGDGKTSFVDAADVGAVGGETLLADDYADIALAITGPEALDYHEVAATLSDVLDRPVRYTDPSLPRFAYRNLSRGEPLGFVLVMCGIYTTARLGFAGRVTDDVERVLGRPPRSVRETLAANRSVFDSRDITTAVNQ